MSLADELAALCVDSEYVPEWGGIRANAPDRLVFGLRTPTKAEIHAWQGRDGESDEDAEERDRVFLSAVVTSCRFQGEDKTVPEAVAMLQQFTRLSLEVSTAAIALQMVHTVPTVADLVKGAEVLEKESKGKGLRDLAMRLHLALGGSDTEGNG